MYECNTNLQGLQSIPKFPAAVCEVCLFSLMRPFNSVELRIVLQFQFLIGILMEEKMSQNVSAKCKNQATYM